MSRSILLVEVAVEKEDEDALEAVADGKEVDKHKRGRANRKSAKDPRDAQDGKERESGTRTPFELLKVENV